MNRTIATGVLILASGVWAAGSEPLAVHVTGSIARAATKEAAEPLRQKSEAARKAYGDLEEGLKKQYGKKPEAWPADKQEQLQAARDAFMEAQIDWFYSSGVKQKDIDDSVRDLSEALGKKLLRTAATRDEADLVVQVLGRAKVS